MNVAELLKADTESLKEWFEREPEEAREWTASLIRSIGGGVRVSDALKEIMEPLGSLMVKNIASMDLAKYGAAAVAGFASKDIASYGAATAAQIAALYKEQLPKMDEILGGAGLGREIRDIDKSAFILPPPPRAIELPMLSRIRQLNDEIPDLEPGQQAMVWIDFGGREYRLVSFDNVTGFAADAFVEGLDRPLHLTMAFQYRIEIVDALDQLDDNAPIH